MQINVIEFMREMNNSQWDNTRHIREACNLSRKSSRIFSGQYFTHQSHLTTLKSYFIIRMVKAYYNRKTACLSLQADKDQQRHGKQLKQQNIAAIQWKQSQQIQRLKQNELKARTLLVDNKEVITAGNSQIQRKNSKMNKKSEKQTSPTVQGKLKENSSSRQKMRKSNLPTRGKEKNLKNNEAQSTITVIYGGQKQYAQNSILFSQVFIFIICGVAKAQRSLKQTSEISSNLNFLFFFRQIGLALKDELQSLQL